MTPAQKFWRGRPGCAGDVGVLSPSLSTTITLARLGLGLLRQADRASAACSCPRHAEESSAAYCADCADCADCANAVGAGKCDCCCGSAERARAGDCAAVHSDGGPGAGCMDVYCDEAACRGFRCRFAHYPCTELRKPCLTPPLPNKRLTYTALWAPRRGGPLCNVAGAHRVAAPEM